MAELRSRQNNIRTQGIYPSEQFHYEPKSDTYQCPAGQWLYNHHYNQVRGYYEYRTLTATCQHCQLRNQCTRSKTGRSLKRYPKQHLLDRARRQSHSQAARLDRARRQHFQEGNFAHATTQHGFKRARWRGLHKQSIQDWLIAVIQNLKVLIRRGAYFIETFATQLRATLTAKAAFPGSILTFLSP